MSSSAIDKVTSSTKSFIETFTSSENPTTTFTEHTVENIASNGIVQKVLAFISQPKFKWYLLGLLLCVIAFIYFKFQNKKPKKENFNTDKTQETSEMKVQENTNNDMKENITLLLQERDKEWINKINNIKNQYNTQLATQADVNSKLVHQINEQNLRLHAQQQKNPPQQQKNAQQQHKNTSQELQQQLSESSCSEEIFIEDKNVMEHNLTAEEMNAIDKQLEEVNLDHLMHASE